MPAWARDIGIARRPGLCARHYRASGDLENEDPAVAREALRELTTLDKAMTAVRA
ncbi:hypothetical protein [Streptomyces sp. NBC_01429]|uniref:hypothetical protein n=1 Tax=Streptomyces sp. NBC_01429 TaxID=2903862 RepID=UPI002E2A9D1D|nr:hypothetical protein [Streptomyces sp. NBC_01429]